MIHYRMKFDSRGFVAGLVCGCHILVGLLRVTIVAIGNLDAALGCGSSPTMRSDHEAHFDTTGTKVDKSSHDVFVVG